jgi:hypothetical protein
LCAYQISGLTHTIENRRNPMKLIYAPGFVFVLALTCATAQSTNVPQTTPPVNPSTPATQVGSGAQTKEGTPAPAPSTTGGVAGTASSTATQAPDAAAPNGVSAPTDSDLESQIQNALSKEPTLNGDSPHVTVSSDNIDLSGKVNTSKEKITATRIVQSYAGSKKLVNHLTVGNQTPSSTSDQTGKDNQPTGSNSPKK